MASQQKSIFERYPQLLTLRGKVPDEVVEREVGQQAKLFEHYASLARQRIPAVKLCDVFPPEMEKGRVKLENFLGQWGNISIEELCKICLIVRWLSPKAVFEFGTFNGLTTLQMAINAPQECRIYTLDIAPDSQDIASLELGEIDQHVAQKVGAFAFEVGYYFKKTPYERQITQVWGDSTKADLSPYHNQVDLVFVDAGHAYDYVKADTENALKMLRPGGVILWHNYMDVLCPDVTQCLYEFCFHGLPIYHLRGTYLAIHHRPEEP